MDIAKIKSLCDKIATDVADSISDPTVISVFNDICEAVRLISKTQDMIIYSINVKKSPAASNQSYVSLGAIPGRILWMGRDLATLSQVIHKMSLSLSSAKKTLPKKGL